MSNFRNVDPMPWLPGGTYRFEFYANFTPRDPEPDEFIYYDLGSETCVVPDPQIILEGNNIYDSDGLLDPQSEEICGALSMPAGTGSFFFDNNNEDFSGGVPGFTIIDWEDIGEGWWRFTIMISEEVAPGDYYVKSRNFCMAWEPG